MEEESKDNSENLKRKRSLRRKFLKTVGLVGLVTAFTCYISYKDNPGAVKQQVEKKHKPKFKFGKLSLGLYFFYNFLISPIVNRNLSKIGISPIANDFLSYNHTIDQRNIGIVERLLELSELLPQEDFKKGKYALVEFGKVHFPGEIYYLSNSNARKIKSVLYVPTYNLLDSNEISRFDPTSDGWQKTVITK